MTSTEAPRTAAGERLLHMVREREPFIDSPTNTGMAAREWLHGIFAIEAEAAEPTSPDVVEALYECLVALVGLAEGPGVTEFARGLKQAAAQHAISEARRALAGMRAV